MRALVLAVIAVSFASSPALGQHAPAPAPEAGSSTRNLQGQDPRQFVNNRYIREFYDLSVATLGPGAAKPDIDAYEQKSLAIFHAFGESMRPGGGPGMQDHLKLIPRQVVQIVKDDPHALDSFDTFTDALVGPK